MHKRIKLTSDDRQRIWQMYQSGEYKISKLAEIFKVSRPTIYKVLERARKKDFSPRCSTNKRYRSVKYGLKRLAKAERNLENNC